MTIQNTANPLYGKLPEWTKHADTLADSKFAAPSPAVREIELPSTSTWSPSDGALGSWNAEYDSIALRQIHHVRIDHNTYEDLASIDSTEPSYFGVHYERHDSIPPRVPRTA